jgi:hypothetical protein
MYKLLSSIPLEQQSRTDAPVPQRIVECPFPIPVLKSPQRKGSNTTSTPRHIVWSFSGPAPQEQRSQARRKMFEYWMHMARPEGNSDDHGDVGEFLKSQ